MLQKKKSGTEVSHKGKTSGCKDLGDDFSTYMEHRELRLRRPVRGVDRLHHSQCLLTNAIDHAPTTSYSTLCLHWTPWPQTVPDFKSEAVFEGFEIENDCEALAGLH